MSSAFLDTSGWFAAISPKESVHRAALAAYSTWIGDGTKLITTNLVVAEMQILLSRFLGADEGLRFLDSLYLDTTHEVVFVDRALERAAVDGWLRKYRDKQLSLTDAVSFEVMQSRGIRRALALDEHFQIAGFDTLIGK